MVGARLAASISKRVRRPRVVAFWFGAQAVAVAAFWPALALMPSLRVRLLTGDIGGVGLWGFGAADITIVGTSLLAALAASNRYRNAWLLMAFTVALSAYPAAYFIALALTGSGGELGAILMASLVLISTVMAVASFPFSGRIPGRLANAANRRWMLLKTLCELAIIWTAFLWLLPSLLVRFDEAIGWQSVASPIRSILGDILVIGGGVLLAWSALHMTWRGRGTPFPLDAPHDLVVDGPYEFVRNPQVVGSLIQGLGLLVLNPSPSFVAFVVGGVALWQLLLRPWEEADLEDRFAGSYDDYRRRVPCWIPRPRGSGQTLEAPSTEEAPSTQRV
jgi:protein-S-isoprenylcysteine O-methyltransferase Ste14